MAVSDELEEVERDLHGHYGWVLGALLGLLAVFPFVEREGGYYWLIQVAFLATIILAILTATRRRAWFWLVAAAVVGELLSVFSERELFHLNDSPARALRGLVFFAVIVLVLRDVLKSRRVTMDTVFAASAVYLLMALGWAALYSSLEAAMPGSFSMTPAAGNLTTTVETELVYFSLITLTTVGYGDISPVSPQARMISALEGVIGQLYIAIILARMVALEISSRRRGP